MRIKADTILDMLLSIEAKKANNEKNNLWKQ